MFEEVGPKEIGEPHLKKGSIYLYPDPFGNEQWPLMYVQSVEYDGEVLAWFRDREGNWVTVPPNEVEPARPNVDVAADRLPASEISLMEPTCERCRRSSSFRGLCGRHYENWYRRWDAVKQAVEDEGATSTGGTARNILNIALGISVWMVAAFAMTALWTLRAVAAPFTTLGKLIRGEVPLGQIAFTLLVLIALGVAASFCV